MLLRKAAGDLMIEEVVTVSENENVFDITKKLANQNLGAVIVTNKAGDPVGIFTERDLLKRVIAQDLDPKKTLVSTVMTSKFTSVTSDSDIEDLTEIMVEGNFRHLPIIDQKALVGIISIKDMARYLAGLPPRRTAAAVGRASKKLD